MHPFLNIEEYKVSMLETINNNDSCKDNPSFGFVEEKKKRN